MTARVTGRAEDATRLTMDDLFTRAAAGLPCWVRGADGVRTQLPLHRWLGTGASATDRLADAALLRLCTGPTLDLGCGPGRLTAALGARGLPALGVDTSAVAVRMTVARGALALRRDVYDDLPGSGRWRQVVLADGNIGIGGDPVRLLRRSAALCGPGGTVVVELEPGSSALRVERMRLETEDGTGPWFRWATAGVGVAADLAASAELELVDVTEVGGRAVARFTAPATRAACA